MLSIQTWVHQTLEEVCGGWRLLNVPANRGAIGKALRFGSRCGCRVVSRAAQMGARATPPGRALRVFANDRRAASAVEFALLAGVFVQALLGLYDVGMTLWAKSALRTAVFDTQRVIRIGNDPGLTQAVFKDRLCQRYISLSFGSCDDVYVDLRIVNPAASTGFDPPVPTVATLSSFGFAFDSPTAGSVVIVRAFVNHQLVTPGLSLLGVDGGDRILLQAATLLWVES